MAVKDKGKKVTEVTFGSKEISLGEAAVLLRRTVAAIKPLNDSLLGRTPSCAEQMGLPLKQHREVRKFRDLSGLQAYEAYLYQTISQVPEYAPNFMTMGAEHGFEYGVYSGVARIALVQNPVTGNWLVQGAARFQNPYSVLKNLPKLGLRTKLERVKA